MGWMLSSGCSWCGDDGTDGEPEAAVSFGEVAMEKQNVWNDFVILRKLLGNADGNTNVKQIYI